MLHVQFMPVNSNIKFVELKKMLLKAISQIETYNINILKKLKCVISSSIIIVWFFTINSVKTCISLSIT